MSIGEGRVVALHYKNWRGVEKHYRILPHPDTLRWGSTAYHKEDQWLFDATDLGDHGIIKTFALTGIITWADALDQTLPWRS